MIVVVISVVLETHIPLWSNKIYPKIQIKKRILEVNVTYFGNENHGFTFRKARFLTFEFLLIVYVPPKKNMQISRI